jgi:hypothetical protein
VSGPPFAESRRASYRYAGSSAGEARGLPLLGWSPLAKLARVEESIAQEEVEVRSIGYSWVLEAKKIAGLPLCGGGGESIG